MISKIRKYIGKQNFIKQIFAKIGGLDYAIYDRTNIILGYQFIDYFVTTDGAKYKVNFESQFTVGTTRLEYDWSDMRPDDIILDIGANVGGFAIGAALKAKHVYAVEPIFYKELEENVKLNNLSNITILPFAIGNGGNIDLSYNKNKQNDIITYPLSNIINMIQTMSNNQHKVSFLKCDCEGGEWYIKPSNLIGIRRIEMEVHPDYFPTEAYNRELISCIKQNWNVTFTNEGCELYIIHAHGKYDELYKELLK